VKIVITVVPENQMDERLDAEIRRGLCVCFPADVDVFSKTRAWHGSGPAWSVMIEEGPVVIAHLGAVERTVEVDGELVRAAGLQNVYVLPDRRGKGYVDQLLAAAMEEAGRRRYDCGLLFCVPELEKVYARCGWKAMEGIEVMRMDEQGQDTPLPGRNVAMYYPLARRELSGRRIHLRGNDW